MSSDRSIGSEGNSAVRSTPAAWVSQARQAEQQAGLTTEALGRLERGEQTPRLDTLFRIAGGLDVDARVLLSDDPAAEPLEQDLIAVLEPLVGQPPAVRAAAARIVRALVEK